jgi:hypothetical protein
MQLVRDPSGQEVAGEPHRRRVVSQFSNRGLCV